MARRITCEIREHHDYGIGLVVLPERAYSDQIVGGYGLAHDVIEHINIDGSVGAELQAAGSALFIRNNCYFKRDGVRVSAYYVEKGADLLMTFIHDILDDVAKKGKPFVCEPYKPIHASKDREYKMTGQLKNIYNLFEQYIINDTMIYRTLDIKAADVRAFFDNAVKHIHEGYKAQERRWRDVENKIGVQAQEAASDIWRQVEKAGDRALELAKEGGYDRFEFVLDFRQGVRNAFVFHTSNPRFYNHVL